MKDKEDKSPSEDLRRGCGRTVKGAFREVSHDDLSAFWARDLKLMSRTVFDLCLASFPL